MCHCLRDNEKKIRHKSSSAYTSLLAAEERMGKLEEQNMELEKSKKTFYENCKHLQQQLETAETAVIDI